jgi:hypothetical protein
VAGALLVGLCFGASAVFAQEDPGRIPGSALGAQGQPSDKDKEFVDKYITYWIKELKSGEPARISVARGKLVEPYNQGGTEAFVAYYDQMLANRIGEGLEAKDVAGRLNTLIVTRTIRHAKVADAVKTGLKDEVVAVRYQAAVAADSLTANKAVELAVKLGMRGPLADTLKKEKNGFVLEYLYSALANIPDAVGWDAVLTKMGDRLSEHVAAGNAGYDAEISGLKSLQTGIFTASAAGTPVPPKVNSLLLLICVRYMDLASRGQFTDQAKVFIATCNTGAGWALKNSGSTAKQPVAPKTDAELLLAVIDWKKILKADPFKFKDEEIELPKAPAK